MQGAPQRSRRGLIALAAIGVVGIIVVIAVVAGGGNKGRDDYNTWWIETIHVARKAICECKDDACVRKAMADMDDVHKQIEDKIKLSHDQSQEQHEVLGELAKCIKGVPGTDVAPGGGDDTDTMLAQVTDIRDRMCACKTKACVHGVIDLSDAWLKKYQPGFDQLPATVRRKAMAIAEESKRCYDHVMK